MLHNTCLNVVIAAFLFHPITAGAADETDMQALREQIEQLKQSYEQRIAQLEQRQQAEPAPQQGAAGANAFNPAIALSLSGIYGRLQQDPAIPATGFAMNPSPGHERGLSLGETELEIAANIDADYRGTVVLALEAAGGASMENAYVQTTALGNGFNLTFGRYFSGLGYLNEQHADTWDFTDQPLVYAVFWENQLGEDGLQLKWLAPADTYIQIGGELGRGRGFPGSDRAGNGAGSKVLFAHVGGDLGIEHSWRAGISLHRTKRENASSDAVPDLPGTIGGVSNLFSGVSRTAGVDVVWKYAPGGNLRNRHVKLQGEYFRRNEAGLLTYDTAGANLTGNYTITQSGWYLQGVFQFLPTWRTGLRYDRLDPGSAGIDASIAASVIGDYGYQPSRVSWMLDYSKSEFSRLRLQLARDLSRRGLPDSQLFVQYIMSLGAHGAHQY